MNEATIALVVSGLNLLILGAEKMLSLNDRARRTGSSEQRQDSDIGHVDGRLKRVESAVSAIGQKVESHREEFVEFRGENRADHVATKNTLERIERNLEGLSAQFRTSVVGGGDQVLQVVPLRRGRED